MSTRDICPKCGSMYSLHDPSCGKPRCWEIFYKTTGYSGRIHIEELGRPLEPEEYGCKFVAVDKHHYDSALEMIGRLEAALQYVESHSVERKMQAEAQVALFDLKKWRER